MSRIHLAQFFSRAAGLFPDKKAIRCEGREQTWGELNTATEELAGGLRRQGVAAGDRVAILALNSDRYVEFFVAVWRLSAAVVPLNTRWSKDEIVYALRDSQANILVVDDVFAVLIEALQGEVGDLTVIHMGNAATPANAIAYDALRRDVTPVTGLGGGGEEMAGIFYTGGTTGHPKGAMLCHTGLVATLLAGKMGDEEPDENVAILAVLPMFHLAGAQLAVASAMAGRQLIMHPIFDPGAIIDCVVTDRIDTLSLVPAMWAMLIDHPKAQGADLSSLSNALYGASPMPEGTLRRLIARLPQARFAQGYGQTETAGVCTLLGPADHDPDGPNAHRLKSAGQPILFSELRILDADGKELPRGSVGEIAIRSAGNMLGYWNRPQETAATLKDGWIMSGDAGYMDEDGYLFIVDRTKDMIVTGGENVYSAETESALSMHPAVTECAVIGVPDDKWGERVHALVRLVPGAQASADDLIAHCKAKIAGYKCPQSIEFRDAPFPISAAGKVLKRELRAPYWVGRDRSVN
jgi:acyl-CoA synthetase (AMP-forming)/AMP-acid ligase II